MDGSLFSIRPVRVWDLPRLTQMAYANMTGVDVEFTRFARRPLARLFGHILLPFYLLTAGQGYKAVADGEIAGCAYVHMQQLSGIAFNVNVNKAYRRQGIGRALMQHIEAQVRRASLRWIALQVDRGNEPAQRLYESLNYQAYHPDFLRSGREVTLLPPRQETVSLGALGMHEGRSLFRKYADLERREGDAWAATVIKHDFSDRPPPGGQFWRCFHERQEIGCAWQKQEQDKVMVVLLLERTYWNQPMITRGLLRLLQAQRGSHPVTLDVYFGSSSHHDAAAPALMALGFENRRQAQILMLKALGNEESEG